MIKSNTKKRSATIFPKNIKVLVQLGENIKLACKRRGYSQSLIAERTGLKSTYRTKNSARRANRIDWPLCVCA